MLLEGRLEGGNGPDLSPGLCRTSVILYPLKQKPLSVFEQGDDSSSVGPCGTNGGRKRKADSTSPGLGQRGFLSGLQARTQEPGAPLRGPHHLLLSSGDSLQDRPPSIPLPSPYITFHLWTDQEQLCT
jgi:hypothetical protein